jgi:iron complex transport system permease protein
LKRPAFWPIALLALATFAAAGIVFGSVRIPPGDLWLALTGRADPTVDAIVHTLRLPRVVLAALVGAGLAASGSAMQGVMRNQLAEPYLLGVSGGAAVGAVVALSLFDAPSGVVPIAAFCGAMTSVIAVLLVARAAGGRADPRILLMAGVVIGAFGNAIIMIVLAAASPDRAQSALWWMMGSASEADWHTATVLALYSVAAFGCLLYVAPEIDALSLGEEAAASLGVNTDNATWRVFLFASLLAAATVAAAGLIGFVGLVVPNLVRVFGIQRHRQLLFASAVAGAALLIGADVVARSVAPPRELPLGAVTALIGVPYFLARLRSAR